MRHVVIIGAGQAGAACAAKLRGLGFDGTISVIGDEPAPPYQRPPLSKAYLMGDISEERLWLRATDFWTSHSITMKLGKAVTAIDTDAGTVSIEDDILHYDALVLATGALPRCLPASIGGDLGGVYTVRTIADVARMRPEFVAGRRMAVIGGGYIGLEAAAVGRKLGLHVTVLEMAPRILQRVAAPHTSDYFRNLHGENGVTMLEGTAIAHLTGNGRVSEVRLQDGPELPTDFVIVGIGIAPRTGLAEAAGIALENGIRTDARGQTSAAKVWAAGDCASFPLNGEQIRIESVGNAIDQAELVAANIMGAAKDYVPKPWFWSDQYDCKLQIAGLNKGYDQTVMRPGENGSRSIWYFAQDRLLAVDAMNDSKAYMVGKRLIEGNKTADPNRISDTNTDLRDLMR